jgi:phospholipid-binding lipoprotein MlaA
MPPLAPAARSRRPARRATRFGLALATLLLAGGASAADAPAAKHSNPDPFERMNRATYRFNDFFDRHLARPLARGYRAVLPEFARRGIGNFFANVGYPTVIVNDVLQLKLKDAAGDTGRLVVNTVVGVGGLVDPATRIGLPAHDEDFGQTLGRWGVRPGPYLVLPLLGPSDLRDAPGRFVDHYTNAEYLIKNRKAKYALVGADLLETRAELLAADEAISLAYDPYALVRNAYLQRREYLVRDGQVPDEGYDELTDP